MDERTSPAWMKTHTGPVNRQQVYDQYGRPINPGDMIALGNHPGEIFRVSVAKPILRPDVPAGVIELQLVQVILQPVEGGIPVPGVIKVRDAGEYLTAEQLEQFKQAVQEDTQPHYGPKLVVP